MAINKKLIHFQNKTAFTTELNAGNILDTSIVFIKDTKEIWTHGQLYSCSLTEEEVISIIENSDSISSLTNALNNKVDKVDGKSLTSNDFTDTLKTKLDGIEENANNYKLPAATATTLGGVIVDNILNPQSTNPAQTTVIYTAMLSVADSVRDDMNRKLSWAKID